MDVSVVRDIDFTDYVSLNANEENAKNGDDKKPPDDDEISENQ